MTQKDKTKTCCIEELVKEKMDRYVMREREIQTRAQRSHKQIEKKQMNSNKQSGNTLTQKCRNINLPKQIG